MPCHIQRAEADLAQSAPADHEVLRVDQFLHQFGGDFLARFIMFGEAVEDFLFVAPVFLKLGGEFDEIPPYGCSREGAVGHIGEQAVDGVSHFVIERCDFAVGEQRGFVLCRFGEVTDDGDDGAFDLAVEEALVAVIGHPCALVFAFARVEIGEEGADEAVVIFIVNIISFYIRMPDGVAVAGFEADAEEFAEMVEAAVQNLIELVIGAEIFGGEVEEFLFEFFGVIADVPRHQLIQAVFLFREVLEHFEVFDCGGFIGGFELFKEFHDLRGGFCHAFFQDKMGVGVIAEKFCAFVLEFYDVEDVFRVIKVVVPCAGAEGAPYMLAQFAAVGVLQEGAEAGVIQCEDPFAVMIAFFGGVGGAVDGGLGEAGEVFFVFNDQLERFCGFDGVLHEGGAEGWRVSR